MRKAFTLVEMLVVITVLPVAALALSRIFATFVQDIPRMTRVVQRNTTVLDMVQQLRDDMDRAATLPGAFEAKHADDRTLLVGLAEGVVCYELQDGRAVRSVLGDTGHAEGGQQRTWTFPHSVVTWSRWQENETAYAVEIHTHVKQKVGSQVKARLANSYVLFVRGLGKGGQRQ